MRGELSKSHILAFPVFFLADTQKVAENLDCMRLKGQSFDNKIETR